jgi:membrane protease subunit (stomatin/prohibitin family)
MGFWDKIRGEFIDVIEWLDDSNDTMVYRFERYGNEIKYGAMLTVREGQVAILVNEGQLADIFEPGLYKLETNNIPILSTLQGWPHGFQSPFKAEVYFFTTRRFTDLKWGTKKPITLRDREFGPVRLRAFGSYSVRTSEPATFLREIVGTDGHFTTDEITNQLRNLIVSRFAAILGESGIPVLDLAANYDQLSEFVSRQIAPEFGAYGLELTKMLVENISLPSAVEEVLDRRTSMGIVGDLNAYTQFQSAEAMRAAADNPAGGAAEGIGMGMGFAMAHHFSRQMPDTDQQDTKTKKAPTRAAQATPPPLPHTVEFYVAINGQQTGPFSQELIIRKIQIGEILQDTLVWSQGMINWAPAGQVAALSHLFAATPPPLPPT